MPSPGGLRVLLAVLVTFAVAFAVRWTHIDYGLPYLGEADTYIVQQTRGLDERGLLDRHYAGWKYPHLIATVTALTPEPPHGAHAPVEADLETHLEAAAAPILRVRRVVAVLSALVAPATLLLALRVLPLGWAALAGLIAGLGLLDLVIATQARPHAVVAATLALAYLACVRLVERPSVARSIVAGLAAAAAASTLHFGAAAAASFVVASILATRTEERPRLRRGLLRFLAGAVPATLVVAWFYVQDPEGNGATVRAVLGPEYVGPPTGIGTLWLSNHRLPLSLFDGGGWKVFWHAFSTTDPAAFGLAVVGLLVGLARRVRGGRFGTVAWIVGAAAVPSLLVLGNYSLSHDRFYVSLAAPVALLAAYGARTLWRAPILGPLVAGAALVGVALPAAAWTWLRAQPDTYAIAAEIVAEDAASGARLFAPNLHGLPLPSRSLDAKRRWTGEPWDAYQVTLKGRVPGAVDLSYLPYAKFVEALASADPRTAARAIIDGTEADIVLVDPHSADLPLAPPERAQALFGGFVDALRDGGWTLRTTVVGQPKNAHAVGFTVSLARLWTAQRLGQTIQIWDRVSEPADGR